jgi:hypothetical protein
MMASIFYSVALIVIAASCLLAVLYQDFEDNLMQRVGLSSAFLGAVARLSELFEHSPNETHARYLFTYGLAVYCLGTVFKLWKKS